TVPFCSEDSAKSGQSPAVQNGNGRGTVPFCSEDSAKSGQSPAVQNGCGRGTVPFCSEDCAKSGQSPAVLKSLLRTSKGPPARNDRERRREWYRGHRRDVGLRRRSRERGAILSRRRRVGGDGR